MIKRLISSFIVLTFILTLFPQEGYTETSKTEKIISFAKEQLGVPYRFGGSTPKGFDCSGFLLYVFNKAGISLPRTASDQYNIGIAVKKSELQVGDLVFFETYKPGPSHSGIYVGDSKFIHASSSQGISIASVNDPYYWSSRYLGARRVLEEPASAVLATLPQGQFHDIPEDFWAYTQVSWLSEHGYINGYDQSLFLPDEVITRGQAAVVLANVFALNTSNVKNGFDDVPENHWAVGAITAVTEADLMRGANESSFKPEDVLTREQIAVVISRAFDLKVQENARVSLDDVPEDYWAYPAIQELASNGIASIYSDNTYRLKDDVTRAEFSVMVYRALHR